MSDTKPKTDEEPESALVTQQQAADEFELGDDLRHAPPGIRASVRAARSTPANKAEKESVTRLTAESTDFFGVDSHVAHGAFHALEHYGITALTREQGKAVIEQWLQAPVDEDPRVEVSL